MQVLDNTSKLKCNINKQLLLDKKLFIVRRVCQTKYYKNTIKYYKKICTKNPLF